MTQNRKGTTQSPRKHRAYVGPCLLAVCLLHIAVGAVDGASLLAEAVREGWAGAFTGERATLMWFLMTGVVGLVAAVAITVVERSGRMPWFISITLLITAGVGVSMAPTSGFVLVLVVGLLAVWRSWATSSAAASTH